jgi:hypothetical protein
MTLIEKRVVLHFPGFEPLDGTAHRARYERSGRQSAAVWGFRMEAEPASEGEEPVSFDVATEAEGWRTQSRIHMLDHDVLVKHLRTGNALRQIAAGFLSGARVVLEGGLAGYFRHAWRFGLFFVFPFLLTALGLILSAEIALLPYLLGLPAAHFLWSVALAACFFAFGFLPFSERFHTLHLFADWEMAVALARMDRTRFNEWLEGAASAARRALEEEADEYVISSHSMGSSVAAHVIGMLLEREPELFAGKRVVFATLGCAILQCSLLSSADRLRSRVGLIARCKDIFWLDVQCLTDSINFYKVPVVAASGHPDAPQATMTFIRVRQMLTSEHYRKIRKDFLRVHRQYVLGPDLKAPFDFTLLTSGPLPAAVFARPDRKKMPG